MRQRIGVVGVVTILVGLVLAGAAPAGAGAATAAAPHAARIAAAGPPVVIGVDSTPPPGKNWEYTHYFPETNVSVPQGGLALFQWNAGSLNGLHTVTFIPTGMTEAQVRAADPTIAADTDNGESDTVIPPQTNNPTSATCGVSPTAPPCVFDGTSVVSSGIIPNATGAAFPVQIAPTTAPGTYHYICLIHPGMSGTITVVAAGQPATSGAALAAQAAAEYNQLTAGALAAEAAAEVPTSSVNADGSHTWTVKVGITVGDVELLEYLPANVPIKKGDSVSFDGSGTTQEPHTVTTTAGARAGLGFFGNNQCESASGPDTTAQQVNGPPQLGCVDPNGLEQQVNLTNQGAPTVISSGATQANAYVSGRADTQALGGGTAHTYQFPANGRFILVCTIHQGMFGIVSTPGYRVASRSGAVSAFGASDSFGSNPGTPSPVVASPATNDNQGYWLVTADGHTYNYGSAPNVGNIGVHNGSPIVGATAATGGTGLLLVAKDGRVYPLGGAPFMGDLGGVKLAAPVVGIAAAPQGGGYDLAAADGGVFTFGTSSTGGPRFFGSLGHTHLNAPIVGIADTLDGQGYYLAAADGGIFTFGSATFEGSLGAIHLAAPIVGFTITYDLFHAGYRLVAADGGVFNFGDAGFLGSAAPATPRNSVVAINNA